MSRFKPGMSRMDKVFALSDGLPGVVGVLLGLCEVHEEFLNILDQFGIVGADIHLLSEVCGGTPDRLAVMLACAKSGKDGLSGEKLLHAAHNRGEGIDVDGIMAKIDDAAERQFRRMFG